MQSTGPNWLLLDCGNSFIKGGRFIGSNFNLLFKLPTGSVLKEPSLLTEKVKGEMVAAACVVPEVEELLKENCRELLLVSLKLKLPLKINYKGSMGGDRICNMCGAYTLFKSFIVASFGTATVIDVVVNGEFKGGAILPGIELMGKALSKGTSLLPDVRELGKTFLAKSTSECIKGGILAATLGAIDVIKRDYPWLPLILTGGGGRRVKEFACGVLIEELTFLGIREILKLNWGA
jgi:type III pantothenate kinase